MRFEKKLTVEHKYHSCRLDTFIFKHLKSIFSRTEIKGYINSKMITVEGQHLKPSYRLTLDQEVFIKIENNYDSKIVPENIPINILYEDSSILVLDKDPGMVVHPGAGNHTGTLANALAYYFKDSLKLERMGIVHRLDKYTSGIMIVAKNNNSHKILSKQFKSRQIKKVYRSIVWGKTAKRGQIDSKIVRDRYKRTKFTVGTLGKESNTNYKTLSYLEPLSYLELYPLTGRTHQIRVHLSSIGKPIFGDELYGGGPNKIKSFHCKFNAKMKYIFSSFNRFALHAYSIELLHPETNKKINFTCSIPDDINNVIEELKSE
ncbi:MAG: hypothetical protein CBD58_03570 [bacterium TMED198]|nr:MAG: hypothetical protein CBD58_03570 [bacterium TMED198]